MSSMEQNDERRILGQMVRFQNQAAVGIDNDCVNRREIDLHGTNPRSQGQEKEKKRLFHFAFHAQLHGLTRYGWNNSVMFYGIIPSNPVAYLGGVGQKRSHGGNCAESVGI